MLKPAMIFFGALAVLTGCTSPSPRSDARPPVPLVWDISQEGHPPAPSVPPPPPAPEPPLAELPPDPPDVAATNHFEETWVGLNHWAEACGFAPVERLAPPPVEMGITNGFQWHKLSLKARLALIPLPVFSLPTTNGVLTLQAETRAAYLNDIRFYLGFTPSLVQGELLVHTLDLQKTIAPLLKGSLLPATNRTLVIDPDDNPDDPAVPDRLRNGNLALDWAQRLASLLATNGWTVLITRTNSANVPPADRAVFADMHPSSLFLSLGFGVAGTDETRSGLETYCLAPAGLPSNVPQTQLEETWRIFPNNDFDAENWQYAFHLHRVLIQIPGARDLGLRRSRYIPILCDRACPAVRISGGYLTNPHDAALIASPDFRQKLAEAVAAALQ
jgi:N-acetylmuramoyl-L-alanine amidase